MLAVAFLDYTVGMIIYSPLLYFLPVGTVTWGVNRGFGQMAALVSTGLTLAVDLTSNPNLDRLLPSICNSALLFGSLLFFVALLTSLKNARAACANSARTDELTHVANRRVFFEAAKIELARSRRYDHPFSLVIIALENLKAAKDIHDRHAGDAVLRTVAANILEKLRVNDLVARLSEDEFVLLLSEIDPGAAALVTRRLRESLLDKMDYNRWPVAFSIGIASFLKAPGTVEEMLKKANQLLYAVRSSGKTDIKQEFFCI